MRRALSFAALLALVLGASALFGGHGSAAAVDTACSTRPDPRLPEVVFKLEAGEGLVRPSSRDKTVRIVCRRLQAAGVADARVRSLPGRRIGVTLPRTGSASSAVRALEQAIVPGRLFLYDWEANLIGPEVAIGGHPGRQPPARALNRAEREWRATGRNPRQLENAQLVFAGSFPTAYLAVKLASEQPHRSCSHCSASTPRFYMFAPQGEHELIAGPAETRARLSAEAAAAGHSGGLVLRVPVGTAIVSELPVSPSGATDFAAEPGWFALRDRPALKGSEIVDPEQTQGAVGEPLVVFGFSRHGRAAFERVTRTIAQRGQASAIGPVTMQEAAALSGHLAVVVDGEVKTRPIINFAENPAGIDGRTGAQISGFANIDQAQSLVQILESGALPLDLALLPGRKPLR